MQKLNFPKYNFRLKKSNDDFTYIFDETRKKWLQLTPEEWVRQHWIYYLIEQKGIPKPLISCEVSTKINSRKKRSDILVYKDSKVQIIVECKRPNVQIDQKTLNQILMYNKSYFAKYLVLSNGVQHKYFIVDYDAQTVNETHELPDYKQL